MGPRCQKILLQKERQRVKKAPKGVNGLRVLGVNPLEKKQALVFSKQIHLRSMGGGGQKDKPCQGTSRKSSIVVGETREESGGVVVLRGFGGKDFECL